MKRTDGSPFPALDTPEQDGVIARTLAVDKRRSVFPVCPRAFHGGFVGYNHPHDSNGGDNPAPDDPLPAAEGQQGGAAGQQQQQYRCAPLQVRHDRLETRLREIEEAAKTSGNRDGDVMVVHLENYDWTELQLIPNCDFWRGAGNAGCPDPFTQDGERTAG